MKKRSAAGVIFYTPFNPEELGRECTREKLRTLKRTMTGNKWDGRLTREQQFVDKLKKKFPGTIVKDCSAKIWDLRIIKSPAEIALMQQKGAIQILQDAKIY
ncbi:MAG TPA: hypothetical protein ENH29_03885 [Bacteroidetes bacterium]|nr:hypothetical protein [Bacteroidota bacterium]